MEQERVGGVRVLMGRDGEEQKSVGEVRVLMRGNERSRIELLG